MGVKLLYLLAKCCKLCTKNTPVHWVKIHPINQKCSLVQRKEFIGLKTHFQSCYHLFIASAAEIKKPENPWCTITNSRHYWISAVTAACRQ